MSYYLIILFIGIVFYLSKYINISNYNREKVTSYECGFTSIEDLSNKYYVKYYIIAIIFLLFDLETIIIYPIAIFITNISYHSFILLIYFIFILVLGLVYEIKNSITIY